jgi:DNA-binding NarL/FixJ family response regulator
LIRIAIVSPVLALRIGLHQLLGDLPDVEVTIDASNAQGLPPVDVIIFTSAALLGESTIEPGPVLLLSDHTESANLFKDVPVWGLLPLESTAGEIHAAIHALVEGLIVGAPGLLENIFEKKPRFKLDEAKNPFDILTERERQVLQLASEGLTNKGIASALQISEHTVKFHLSSLYSKLGVVSRTEAIRFGIRQGWVVM